jgi:hypothetical protein
MGNSQVKDIPNEVCEGCGAAASGGKICCQGMFEEVIAREFSDYRYGRIHRLTVDAYCLQHPDQYMRSGKSFAAHLTGMCSALEYQDSLDTNRTVQKWLSGNPVISKPARLPQHRGDLTIMYIHGAADADEHTKRVQEWAHSIWEAWSEYHSLARQLIIEATTKTKKQ